MTSALNQVQLGDESSWGTAAAGTVKLMGVEDCQIEPMVSTVLHGERRGSLAPGHNTNIAQVGGAATLDLLATYEDLPYLFDGLFSEATPGAATAYERTYAAPLTSLPTPRYTTLIYGKTGSIARLEGGLISQLVLTGEHSEPLRASARYEGVRVVGGTLAALSDRSVNFMMGDQAKLYIDAWAGTVGTTEITATSWSFQLTINPNRKMNRSLGSLTPISWHDGDATNRWTGELRLSLEMTSAVAAYLTGSVLQATPSVFERQVRVEYEIGANQTMAIDFAGVMLSAPTLYPDNDGLVTVDLVLNGKYNSAMGNWLEIAISNGVATLA